ncbi:TIR domain-containing protein [Streptomyces sp. NPDC001388]|uniref:toll/interleukin-1 receptor domain-containing protein n=1 Tax=Streptomyces sp. NPDC001388 TaxID=3364568 RepID=UPI0036A25824
MTTELHVPRVFIGHIAEDRDAFVEPLARELAELGVRAWVDFWEVRLGDSLTGSVFTDGMDAADGFVLVLSPLWHRKAWLKDQLEATAQRRIQDRRTLIPVLLDDVPAPPPLLHLKALRCPRTPEGALSAARRIADTLYGVDPRPVVKPRPADAYPGGKPAPAAVEPLGVRAPTVPEAPRRPAFPGLPAPELALLRQILTAALQRGGRGPLPWSDVGTAMQSEPDGATAARTLMRLEKSGLVRSGRSGDRVAWCELTARGYRVAAPQVVADLEDAKRRVVTALVNRRRGVAASSRGRDVAELADEARTHVLVVDRFLADLEEAGHVKVLRAGGHTLVTDISAALGDWAADVGEERGT